MHPKSIRTAALVILVAGTALNMYGFSLEPFKEGPVALFLRSLIISIKMFIYDLNLLEVPLAQEQPLFLELYILVFYAAVLTSISAIIMLFGRRVITLLSLLFRRRKFDHVFIGVNNRSVLVAQGIENEEVAFIEFPDEKEGGKISVSSVLKGLSGEGEKSGGSVCKGALILFAKRRIRFGAADRVFAAIGLEKLKRLVDEHTAFYILSDDHDRNLDELMALLEDTDLHRNTIHVCLSREGVSRYYKASLKHTGVHFIYPSSLSVVELMTTPSCHPASVMTPSKTGPAGTVEKGLNALVVGFGETGQAVTKFLYEFSAAVLPDGTPAPASIVVSDSRIERLKGQVCFDNPGLGETGIISYENYGTESSEFWNSLESRINDLNYISISLKDESASLDLACTIFMYAIKKRRGGVHGLRIIVRKRYTLSHERKLVDKMNEKAGEEVIICYGEYAKVFTAEKIVSKSRSGINRNATSLADRIGKAYTEVSGEKVSVVPDSDSFHSKNRARMELHQMISRANHAASISILTGGATEPGEESLLMLAKMEHLRYSRYLTAHGYSYGEEDDDVFNTNHQICSWEELREEDRKYHLDMVKAQLKVIE